MKIQVAIIGAGPAGLFAADRLAQEGYSVALFNRDIKPGGMAEYGIFLDKHNLKEGLRKQFGKILSCENIEYYGNIPVGENRTVKLADLQALGFDAVLVACGAQGTKWLGIPGENFKGVYHAKEVVYHYNKLPLYSSMDFRVGKRVGIVGVGNVMTDVAHFLVKYTKAEEIYVIGRRGPAEVKFDRKELEMIIHSFDLDDLDREMERVTPAMAAIGQNMENEKSEILSALEKASPREGNAVIKIRFLTSPKEIIGGEAGNVTALMVEENTLVSENGAVSAKGTGKISKMNLDTLIFAIGDKVEDELGLPVDRNDYRSTKNPRYSIEGQSYEIEDPLTGLPMDNIFVAGWARKASTGLVGNARKDGVNAALAMIEYLKSKNHIGGVDGTDLQKFLSSHACQTVDKAALSRLIENEKQKAGELGLLEFKYSTNEEMLKVIGSE